MIDAWLRLSARSQTLWLFGASALIALAGLPFFEGAVVDGTGRTLLAARWVSSAAQDWPGFGPFSASANVCYLSSILLDNIQPL